MGTDRQRRRVIMIDLYPCKYTYEETDTPIEEDSDEHDS